MALSFCTALLNPPHSCCSKEVKTSRKCCWHKLFRRACFISSNVIVAILIFFSNYLMPDIKKGVFIWLFVVDCFGLIY